IDSTVDIFTFYVPHRHVYGEQWIKFTKDGVNATPLPTVNTTGYIDHAAFLGTINPDTNKIPKHLFQGYLNIYNNYFKAPWMPEKAAELFAFTLRVRAGNTDVLTDAEENVRQKLRAEGVM